MTAGVSGWRAGQHGQHTAWPDTLTDAVIDAWAAGASRVDLRAQFGLTPGQLAGCGWVSDDVDLCTSCAPRGAP